MIQTFTPSDVLKSKTGELTEEESKLLNVAIEENPELAEFAQTLEMLDEAMPKLVQDPGESLTQRIMDKVRLELDKNR
jgi:hypothetical protein